MSRQFCAAIALAIAVYSGASGAQFLFQDETVNAGVEYVGESWGASWGMLDDDIWPDLFVVNHRNRNSLFRNNGPASGFDFTDDTLAVDLDGHWTTNFGDDTHGGSWADFARP